MKVKGKVSRRKKVGKSFKFHEPVYNVHYLVMWGSDIEPLRKEISSFLKTKYTDDQLKQSMAKFIPDERGMRAIIYFKGNTAPISHIVHECFHACYWQLDYIGVRLGRESEEAFAYYLDYLVKTLIKGMPKSISKN